MKPGVSLVILLIGLGCVRVARGWPDYRAIQQQRAAAERATNARAWVECVRAYEQAHVLLRDDGSDLVWAAGCAAESGDALGAVKLLRRAAQAGQRNVAVQEDSSFSALPAAELVHLKSTFLANEAAYAARVNQRLRQLFDEDQHERLQPPADWNEVLAHDAVRFQEVKAQLDGGLRAPEDFFFAAAVLNHSEEIADNQLAHELAVRAATLAPSSLLARALAGAADDRLQMRAGLPQKYGTQFVRDGDGGWSLYPVDERVSDEQRAKWALPPLSEARARVAELNAAPASP